MSKKCPVRSLSDSSLAELANLFVSTLSYAKYSPDVDIDTSIVMVEINTYLEQSGATSNIYQDLLRVILSSDYLDADMRFTCLQMLLNNGVSFLITEVFPFSYYEKILQVIIAQGTGLRVLNLKGVWVKEEHMHYMFDIVRKCIKLTNLYIKFIANDDLLREISNNCKQLKVLDVSGESDITEIGIDFLSKGLCKERLTVIDIGIPGEENICYSDIALLLENCPNLETLATYSYVGAALKFIVDNVDEHFICKLKYMHDTYTDKNTMGIIVRTCPKLEALYLDSPVEGSLMELAQTFLRKIKIYKFTSAEFMQLLQRIGGYLSHLTMIKGTGNIDINIIARACPTLIDLDLYMMENITYSSHPQNHFHQLEGLEILNSPMSNSALKTFICDCLQLKRLAVDSVSLTDEEFIGMFVMHDFNELEDIWFTLAPNLTLQSMEILLDRCPALQSVGQLSGWGMTADDLALIKGLLKIIEIMADMLSHKHLEELRNLCIQNQIKWTGQLCRIGSDGRLVALLLKSIYPKFVDLNNYPSQSSMKRKLCNWETLNFKVLSKLGLSQSKIDLANLAKGTPGFFESLALMIMKLRPRMQNVFTYQGKTFDDAEGIVIVNVDKTVENIPCIVPQKMIIFSAYENARDNLKEADNKIKKIEQKIAHLENLILLKTEIEEELTSELTSLTTK